MKSSGAAGTVKLAKLQICRAIQLLRAAKHSHSLPDIYDAIGLASSLVDDSDRLICSLSDESLGIFNGRKPFTKTFEELISKPKAMAVHA